MSDWAETLSKGLMDLSNDINRMLEDREVNKDKGDNDEKKESSLKSLQRLTTFYANEEEAKSAQEEDPIEVFIDKRLKEIFKG